MRITSLHLKPTPTPITGHWEQALNGWNNKTYTMAEIIARVHADGFHGKNFTNSFIQQHLTEVVNGCLVSEWILVDDLPDKTLLRPKRVDGVWTEGATPQEFEAKRQGDIYELKGQRDVELRPTNKILAECREREILVPDDVTAIRNEIWSRYDQLIEGLEGFENDLKK